MYKEDSALNNQKWLICHKTQPNPNKPKIAGVIKDFEHGVSKLTNLCDHSSK